MNDILLVSECCTSNRYEKMMRIGNMPISASQFMFSNLIKGFSQCNDSRVTVLSSIRAPSTAEKKQKCQKREIDCEYGFEYIYPSSINVSGVHFLWTWLMIFKETARWCREHKNKSRYIVCDSLINCAIPARIAGKLFGVQTVAYVTDLPQFMEEIDEGKYNAKLQILIRILSKMIKKDIVKYDRYITLTEGLNQYANPEKKPHINVECIMDAEVDVGASEKRDGTNFIVMFAGKTNRLFGMETLLEAITLIERSDIQFHIYGKGNYDEQIKEAAKKDGRIVYHGLRPHQEILLKEKQADLLVNNRPTNYQFARLSFPSKVAEYMASGTPVLSTRLPGIPEDYEQYLWYLDNEDAADVANAIMGILSLSDEERTARGQAAKQYIEKNKNPQVQARRVIVFLSKNETEE